MRRQRVRKPDVGMQLFPFLAVLICAMGALIVILVLVTRQARSQADTIAERRVKERHEQRRAAKQQRTQEQEDAQWRQQILAQQRQELTLQMADRRLELSHLEDHIRRLDQRGNQLRLQIAELQRVGAGHQDDQATLQGEVERMQAELQQERQKLEKSREQVAKRRRSYAIIPYRGPNGTDRRPIYIECRSTGIIIRPEGIVVTPDDLAGPLGPGNPLDAALRAIREHWARVEGSVRGGEPYPLLIVRPDGAVAYSVARAAMSAWEDEFGYELVDADMELAFPPSDPVLKQTVEASIQAARERQALLVAAMPRRFDRSPATDRFPEADWGEEDPPGSVAGRSTGGSRSASSGGIPGIAGLSYLAQGYGPSSGLPSASGAGGPRGPGAAFGAEGASRGGYASAEGGRAGSGGGRTAVTSGMPGVPGGGGLGGGGDAGGSGGPAVAGGRSGGGFGGDAGGPGSGFGTGGSPGTGFGGGGPGGAGGLAGGDGPGGGSGGGVSSGGGPGGGPGGGSGGGGEGLAGVYGAGIGGGGTSGGLAALEASGGSRDNVRGGSQDGSGGGSGPVVAGYSGGRRADRSQGDSGDGEAGEDAAKSRGPGSGRGGARSSTRTFEGGPSVSQRKTPDAMGITRPIFVECYPDRLVILPDQGTDGKPQVIPIQGTLRSAISPFASGLRLHMDRWGLAVKGGYWKPVVKVKVAPGAETQFDQLKTLLENNGLEVQKREEPRRRERYTGATLPS